MQLHPLSLIGITAALALVPVAFGAVTSYLKMSIVLSLVKNALGTQSVPGPLIVSALSAALTCSIMAPIFSESARAAEDLLPAIAAAPSGPTVAGPGAFEGVLAPFRKFLETHSGSRELRLLEEIAHRVPTPATESSQHVRAKPALIDEKSLRILIPAFMLTELREAFSMGFILLLPFLVIDLVVANILTGLGMYMMSPITISLPLKLILFVSSDAWLWITRGLVDSYVR